jgi:hypothetical protein
MQVLDLAAPQDMERVTLADLQRCRAGGVIVGMLADVAAFWEHDSKEVCRLGLGGEHCQNPCTTYLVTMHGCNVKCALRRQQQRQCTAPLPRGANGMSTCQLLASASGSALPCGVNVVMHRSGTSPWYAHPSTHVLIFITCAADAASREGRCCSTAERSVWHSWRQCDGLRTLDGPEARMGQTAR